MRVFIALLLVLTMAACGSTETGGFADQRGAGDAQVQQVDDSAVEVYNFADGYPNLATKCVGPGKRAYVQRTEHAVPAVIVTDESC